MNKWTPGQRSTVTKHLDTGQFRVLSSQGVVHGWRKGDWSGAWTWFRAEHGGLVGSAEEFDVYPDCSWEPMRNFKQIRYMITLLF